jgi:TonB family protein
MVLIAAAVLALACKACEERAGYPFGFPFAGSHKASETMDVDTAKQTTVPTQADKVGAMTNDAPAIRPKIISQVDPVYPTAALRDGVEGRVIVKFKISPDGVPFDAQIDSSTHPVFNGPSLRALSKTRFEAEPQNRPLYGGRWFKQPYAFQLEGQPPSESPPP